MAANVRVSFLLQTYSKSNTSAFIVWELCSCRSSNFVRSLNKINSWNIRKIDLVLQQVFSSWTGLPKRTRKVFWTGYVWIKCRVYPSEDSAVQRLERVYEEYTVIQRNIFGCIWCYWSIVDKVIDNSQWLEYCWNCKDVVETAKMTYEWYDPKQIFYWTSILVCFQENVNKTLRILYDLKMKMKAQQMTFRQAHTGALCLSNVSLAVDNIFWKWRLYSRKGDWVKLTLPRFAQIWFHNRFQLKIEEPGYEKT
jgi:hypothetical protein